MICRCRLLFDQVELSNLQRQIIHSFDSIGQNKVDYAASRIAQITPDCQVSTIDKTLDEDELRELVGEHDICVDATDNFPTRFLINRLCVEQKTPLVSGAAIRWEGQVCCFSNQPGSGCYNCLYGNGTEVEETCSSNGVLAPVVGIIGSIQATEVIKMITGSGQSLQGRLLILDALPMQWRSLNIKPDPDCEVCQHAHA